jgi:hypothetical protein
VREVIAMLDGLSEFNVSPSGGSNYSGGGTYPDEGNWPTLPSGAYGLAGAPVPTPAHGSPAPRLSDYMSAFGAGSAFVATVEPGDGQNYTGGGAYPGGGFPTSIAAQGLAGPAVAGRRMARAVQQTGYEFTVEPGGGALYEGGASRPDNQPFPTSISSQGLVGIASSGSPTARMINVLATLLERYAHVCPAAVSSKLRAAGQARKYRYYLQGGAGDAALIRGAEWRTLTAYVAGLQTAIVGCSGIGSAAAPSWTRGLETQARAALAMARRLI